MPVDLNNGVAFNMGKVSKKAHDWVLPSESVASLGSFPIGVEAVFLV